MQPLFLIVLRRPIPVRRWTQARWRAVAVPYAGLYGISHGLGNKITLRCSNTPGDGTERSAEDGQIDDGSQSVVNSVRLRLLGASSEVSGI